MPPLKFIYIILYYIIQYNLLYNIIGITSIETTDSQWDKTPTKMLHIAQYIIFQSIYIMLRVQCIFEAVSFVHVGSTLCITCFLLLCNILFSSDI